MKFKDENPIRNRQITFSANKQPEHFNEIDRVETESIVTSDLDDETPKPKQDKDTSPTSGLKLPEQNKSKGSFVDQPLTPLRHQSTLRSVLKNSQRSDRGSGNLSNLVSRREEETAQIVIKANPGKLMQETMKT